MKLRKFRGYGLKFYLGVVAFGVASSFYILRPVVVEFERRKKIEDSRKTKTN